MTRRTSLGRVAGEFLPDEPQVGQGGSVIVTRRLGGDFAVAAKVNGARISLIFDTGASVVVLTGADAKRAGVEIDNLAYDVPREHGERHGPGRRRAA